MSERCLDGETLFAYLAGAMEPREATAVERHVAECPRCAKVLERMTASLEMLRDSAGVVDAESECPDQESTAAYADGRLSGEAAEDALAHLAECGSCLALLSDLWSGHDGVVPEAAVRTEARVLSTLERESRTAVVNWRHGVATLVRGFERSLDETTAVLRGAGLEPAPAFTRGRVPLRLSWSGPDELELECEVREFGGHPALLGRLTSPSGAARALSVTLTSADRARGPESLDAEGRFGPWPLAQGRNELTLAGSALPAGRTELLIDLVEER